MSRTAEDAKKNPKPGDAFKPVDSPMQIDIIARGPCSVDYLEGGREMTCTPREWRRWYRNAEVVHVAE